MELQGFVELLLMYVMYDCSIRNTNTMSFCTNIQLQITHDCIGGTDTRRDVGQQM